MEFIIGYLLALIVVGLGVLGIILALAIDEISKGKFIISFIFSILLLGLGIYYCCVVRLYQSRKGEEVLNPLNRISQVYRVE